jgi:hypothetical protein
MQNNFNYILRNPSIIRGVFCLCLFLFCYTSNAQPQIKFKDPKKNFGFVKKGEIVTLEFEFTNIGNQPAIISEAKAECSCTTVDYPKQPLPPGQSAKIIVKFDTKATYDRQDRIVEIFSNAKNSYQKIRFKGVVLK